MLAKNAPRPSVVQDLSSYRALWLDNVALATAQVQNSSLAGGTVNIARDDLWIQGVTFGFVVRH